MLPCLVLPRLIPLPLPSEYTKDVLYSLLPVECLTMKAIERMRIKQECIINTYTADNFK